MNKCKRVAFPLSLIVFGWCCSSSAVAAVDIIKADIEPLIRAASKSPVQFAVHVPHAISSAKDGEWTTVDGLPAFRSVH